jgi:hypothetical protein
MLDVCLGADVTIREASLAPLLKVFTAASLAATKQISITRKQKCGSGKKTTVLETRAIGDPSSARPFANTAPNLTGAYPKRCTNYQTVAPMGSPVRVPVLLLEKQHSLDHPSLALASEN